MEHDNEEIERRKSAAMAAIKRAMEEGTDESDVALFASHHLKEIDSAYWQTRTGTPRPNRDRIKDLLELRSHCGGDGDDGIEVSTSHFLATSPIV